MKDNDAQAPWLTSPVSMWMKEHWLLLDIPATFRLGGRFPGTKFEEYVAHKLCSDWKKDEVAMLLKMCPAKEEELQENLLRALSSHASLSRASPPLHKKPLVINCKI